MNKSPIDEMNENEYPDLEENRREGLEMLNRVENNLADLNALEEEPTETTSSSSSETQTEQPPEQRNLRSLTTVQIQTLNTLTANPSIQRKLHGKHYGKTSQVPTLG